MEGNFWIDPYVLDTLMRDLVGKDRRASAYPIYLALLRSDSDKHVALSHQQLADRVGLSKRAVQNAIGHLAARGLLSIERRGRTEPALVKVLMPWRRRETVQR